MARRAEILAALEAVRGAIPAKPFMPILSHVLFSGSTVIGYDNEIAIRAQMPIDLGMTFNVHHDRFYNLMRNLEGEEVELVVEKDRLRISSGQHKSTMMQISDEFPRPIVEMGNMEWSPVPAGFREGVERALMCADKDEANLVICAVLIRNAAIYGLDGKRCCRTTLKDMAVTEPMLLSRKAAEELVKLGNPSKLVVAGPWAVFDYGNLTFLARLRVGGVEYPDIDKLFKVLGDFDIQPIPERLPNALRRLRLMGGAVTVTPGLTTTMESRSERGEVRENLDAIPGLVKKAFNPDHMEEVLQYSSGMFWGLNASAAIYFQGEGGFEFLMMPSAL